MNIFWKNLFGVIEVQSIACECVWSRRGSNRLHSSDEWLMILSQVINFVCNTLVRANNYGHASCIQLSVSVNQALIAAATQGVHQKATIQISTTHGLKC